MAQPLVDVWSRFRTGLQNDDTIQSRLNAALYRQLEARNQFAENIKGSVLKAPQARENFVRNAEAVGFPESVATNKIQHRYINDDDGWKLQLFASGEDAESLINPIQTFELSNADGRIQTVIPGRSHRTYGDTYAASNWDAAFGKPEIPDISNASLWDALVWGAYTEVDKTANNPQGLTHNFTPQEVYDLGGFGGLRGHFLGPLGNLPNVGRILSADPGQRPELQAGGFRGVGQPEMLNALPTPGHQMAAIGGNALGHVITTWPFRAAWSSHPGDLLGRVYAPSVGQQFGFRQQLPGDVFWTVVPAGVAAAGIGSGAIDLGNLLNFEEGPRPAGYQANYASKDDRRKTDNYLLSLLSIPIGGGYSRTLPWEQFTQERPNVSRQDYEDYNLMRRGLADETEREDDFSTAIGPIQISGTMRNLEGVPEINMGGGRMTLPGALVGAGVTGGLLYAMRPRR